MGASSFNEMELDAIGEIMNISLGASATAVSTMLGTKVNITTPVAQVLSSDEFSFKRMEPAVGVNISYVKGLEGNNVMIFRRNDVRVIVGILMGAFGPRLHMVTYTTRSANLMLRGLGLSMYLACLGLDAGVHFFETVFRPEGLLWVGIGFAITFIPVMMVAALALKWMKIDFGSLAGMLCGSMANPMALNYVNATVEGDNPAVSYATVYPLSMFIRVIFAQLILMLFM